MKPVKMPQELATMFQHTCNLCFLPTELLLYIFTHLAARELTKCREVCLRWKYIIDSLQRSDPLWREHCRKDFSNIYKIARRNSTPGMLWFNIYKSLSLWPKLALACEAKDEFAFASNPGQQIIDFTLLQSGIIGVHKMASIEYYSVDSLEKAKCNPIDGSYLKYTENEEAIVIITYQMQLIVVCKSLRPASAKPNTSKENVKSFYLIDHHLYYVTHSSEIYHIDLRDENLNSIFIKRCREEILCMGYMDKLHILTIDRNIYSIVNNNLVLTTILDGSTSILNKLREHNMLENMYWRIYLEWMYEFRQSPPQGPLSDLSVIKPYGDMVFVGSSWGVLLIYEVQSRTELDLYNSEPIRQYNFMERQDCPVLSDFCPILQIDALEAEYGHTVLVAMPKKIAVLNFTHNFKRTASVAMLPYTGYKQAKILKISENI